MIVYYRPDFEGPDRFKAPEGAAASGDETLLGRLAAEHLESLSQENSSSSARKLRKNLPVDAVAPQADEEELQAEVIGIGGRWVSPRCIASPLIPRRHLLSARHKLLERTYRQDQIDEMVLEAEVVSSGRLTLLARRALSWARMLLAL